MALGRIAEWTMAAIHMPNLLSHIDEKGERPLPTSSDWSNYERGHLLGRETAMLEGQKHQSSLTMFSV